MVLCSTNVAATAAAVAPSLAAALAAAAKRSTMSGPAGDAKLQVIDGVRSMQPDPGVLCRDLWSMHAVVALAAAAEPFAAAAAVSVAAAAVALTAAALALAAAALAVTAAALALTAATLAAAALTAAAPLYWKIPLFLYFFQSWRCLLRSA